MRYEMFKNKNKRGLSALKRTQLIFYCAIVTLPFLWWLFSFCYTNMRTILYWFQDYNAETNEYYFVGLEMFKKVGADFLHATWISNAMKNGLKVSLWSIFGNTILGTAVSYYVYKQYRAHKLFHVLLFYPSIVSSVVYIVIFKYFVDQAYPSIIELLTGNRPYGLLMDLGTQFDTLIFFMVFFNLGTGIMVEVSIMANTPPEVIDAVHIDGAGPIREFLHVTFPAMYPTFVITSMGIFTGIFTANPYTFSFFGMNAEAVSNTLGYYMQKQVLGAKVATYPYVATMGAYITIVTVPITILTRKLLIKIGPSED